jgi:tRNA A37 N6-isopentenylltransferase MiaA
LETPEELDQPPVGEMSALLCAWSEGDQTALEKMTPVAYHKLHRLGETLHATGTPRSQSKAKSAYRDFLALWNEADPGIPIFKTGQSRVQEIAVNQ